MLFLNDDGTVKGELRVDESDGGFEGDIDDRLFGVSLAVLDGVDENVKDLVVGQRGADDHRGAVWILDLVDDTVQFLRGDIDGDGTVFVLGDALRLLDWSFLTGEEPPCMDAADVNDDGSIFALTDALDLLEWGFGMGAVPPAPGPTECGADPTEDDLECLVVAEECL